eukprot:TRINITY_DN1671_c0_g2_i6.p1 TRINITY_DN1671_c0_g2~~TRINITY_DN1671_c0_g2_i6.p1  ORF type:complete len:557 (-),score=91.37 TRINITY_DN1671_c0_g2_i6:491-2161(-)
MANPNDWFREVFGEHFPLLYKKLRLVQKKLESEDDIFAEARASFDNFELTNDGIVALLQLFAKKDINSLDEDNIAIEHWAASPEVADRTIDCLLVLIHDWPDKFEPMAGRRLLTALDERLALPMIAKKLNQDFERLPICDLQRDLSMLKHVIESSTNDFDEGIKDHVESRKTQVESCTSIIHAFHGHLRHFANTGGKRALIKREIEELTNRINTVNCLEELPAFSYYITEWFFRHVDKVAGPYFSKMLVALRYCSSDTLLNYLETALAGYYTGDVTKIGFFRIMEGFMRSWNENYEKFFGPAFFELYDDYTEFTMNEEDECLNSVVFAYERGSLTAVGIEVLFRLFKKKHLKTLDNIPGIHWVVRMGLENSLKVLLKDWSPEFRNTINGETGDSVLHAAVSFDGHTKCIELLLKDSPPEYREMQNDRGKTALHIAARGDNTEAIRLLLEGASPTFRDMIDENGKTAVLYASSEASVKSFSQQKKKKRRKRKGKKVSEELKLAGLINAMKCIEIKDYKESTKTLIAAIPSCTPAMKDDLLRDQKIELKSLCYIVIML